MLTLHLVKQNLSNILHHITKDAVIILFVHPEEGVDLLFKCTILIVCNTLKPRVMSFHTIALYASLVGEEISVVQQQYLP